MTDFRSPLVPPNYHDDLPRYPSLLQLVRVTGATTLGPSGLLYVALTQQLQDTLLPRDREQCLVCDPNGAGIAAGYYLGRLAESYSGLPVYEVVGQSGGSKDAGCALASLRTSDCVLATGDGQVLLLEFDQGSGRWISTAHFVYPAGSGLVDFWFSVGSLHLSIDDKELLGCGDGCFTGGPLTGHDARPGASCTGVTFMVCVECSPCPGSGSGETGGSGAGGVVTVCCPGVEVPEVLYATVTSATCPDIAVTVPMYYGIYTGAPTQWSSELLRGLCNGQDARFGFYCVPAAGDVPVGWTFYYASLTEIGSGTAASFNCGPPFSATGVGLAGGPPNNCCATGGTFNWSVTL